MKTVVRLLPTGNVTTTYQDQLRHTHCAWKHTRTHTDVLDCLRFTQRWTCIFKLIRQTHESVHADTFTYMSLACRGPGRDAGWQVLCHFPQVSGRGGVTMWQELRPRDAFHSTVSVQWHNLSRCFSLIPEFSSAEVTFGCMLMWLMTCCFTSISASACVDRVVSGAAPVMLVVC